MAKQTNKKLKKPEMGRNLNKGGDWVLSFLRFKPRRECHLSPLLFALCQGEKRRVSKKKSVFIYRLEILCVGCARKHTHAHAPLHTHSTLLELEWIGEDANYKLSTPKSIAFLYIHNEKPQNKTKKYILKWKNGTSKTTVQYIFCKSQSSWKCSSVVEHLRRLHEVLGWSSHLHP
jgi:hypothetical protein